MSTTAVDIVMRTRNDMPLVEQTVAALAAQDLPHRLTVFDNASTDGTSEVVHRASAQVIEVPDGGYVPGRVLNQAMAATSSDVVVFVNADCTPSGTGWLRKLTAGFSDSELGAVFGRQVARPGCHPLFARDIATTFGDGSHQSHHRHCFSMAASAVRRSAWVARPFNPTIRYSEDVEWTWALRRLGWKISYAPSAVAAHSHNYTFGQWYRRQTGEGQAEASIFDWTAWQGSIVRYSVLPYAAQVLRDWQFCLSHGYWRAATHAPLLRLCQAVGRRRGFRLGLRERRSMS